LSLVRLDTARGYARLRDGLELHATGATLRITALTDGILRVVATRAGGAAPPASWAVLPDMRGRCVPVRHADTAIPTFSTSDLRVTVTSDPLHLSIADPSGHILLEDAPGHPTIFDGAAFRTWKRSPPDERYYGLGDKPGRLARNGRSFRNWNTDDPFWSESSDLLYKTIPVVMAVRQGKACGLLLDNTHRSVFDFGVSNPGVVGFGADGGALDLYVLAGPHPKSVLQRYVALTGAAPLPPLWALGFHQSRYSYETERRVMEIVHEHRRRRIPLDAIWLDIGYQDRNRPFTVDPDAFPDFAGMTGALRGAGVQAVAITDLHVACAPGEGYAPYETGIAGDHFLRNPDGSRFVGESWPGRAVFPDFARAATKAWWGSLYRDFYCDKGVGGFWNDMNEPSVRDGPGKTMPLDVVHRIDLPNHARRTAPHAEMHNVYGLQNTEATHDGLLALQPDRRPFVLTRASYAGGHRSAATWTGDNASTWQHLRLLVPQLMNLGLSGFTLSGADVGGFGGTPPADALTRWTQVGAFTPFFRNHTAIGTGDQEAWVHGPEHEAIRRRAIEGRYRLLPYLYTLAAEAARAGTPIMRPLFLEFPDTSEAPDSQFLFGPALLVAPWPDETLDSYTPFLPEGVAWYDYWSGQKLDSGAGPVLEKRLEYLPVFARGGQIIPHQPLTQSTADVPDGPLILHVYPGPDAAGGIYADDGASFAYRRGEYFRQTFAFSSSPGRMTLCLGEREGTWEPWWRQIAVVMHGADQAGRNVTADGTIIGDVAHDPTARTLAVRIPAATRTVTILLD
jgi:alpha-glucosidase